MRKLPEKLMEVLEDGAMESAEVLRDFLSATAGPHPPGVSIDKVHIARARVAIALLNNYTRAFTGETQRVAVEIAVRRMRSQRELRPAS